MKYLLLVIGLLLQSTMLYAEEPDIKNVTVDGIEGVFFPKARAEKLLQEIKLKKNLEDQVSLLSTRLELEQDRSRILGLQESSEKEISKLWKDSSTALSKENESLRKGKWYQHPVIWFALGVTASGFTAYGFSRLMK